MTQDQNSEVCLLLCTFGVFDCSAAATVQGRKASTVVKAQGHQIIRSECQPHAQ